MDAWSRSLCLAAALDAKRIANAYANSYTCTYSYCHRDSNTYSYCHTYSNRNGKRNSDSDAHGHSDRDTYSDTCAVTEHLHPCPSPDRR